MNLRFFYLLVYILCATNLTAQQEAAIWYFGHNAGLDFRSGAPVALEDGALYTNEGCATISDSNGNLLFYTDGTDVWNRNHQIMPNGFGLLGDGSSSQSAIVVPKPNDPDIYYIFTCFFEAKPGGINYSEVDMTLDGGLGDITVKNINLISPSTEKLTAVNHVNGTDVWVITHDWGNADFLAYRVTPAGVITTPIRSRVGMDLSVSVGPTNAVGYIKASPNGTRLAISHRDMGSELLDFDSATGVVSNPIILNTQPNQYGVEFSPSGNILYLSPFSSELYQYNLNAVDIRASQIDIGNGRLGEAAAQLAVDGKIYITNLRRNTLSVIHDPDVLGSGCNYEFGSIDLGTGNSFWGLPPFIQSFFFISDIQANNLCLSDATAFNINVSEPIASILWDFGDGNTSTMETPTHTYAAPGDYTVNVTVTTASETKIETKQITISEVPVANTVTHVEVCQVAPTHDLDLTSLDTQVLGAQPATDFTIGYFASQADANANVNALAQPVTFNEGTTTVYTRISNSQNSLCYDTSSFDVMVKKGPELGTVADWVVCDDDGDNRYAFDFSAKNNEVLNGEDPSLFTIAYFLTQVDANAATNALPTNYTNTLPAETIFYSVRNSTYPDCFETGSFGLEVIGQVIANQPSHMQACDDTNDGIFTFDLTTQEAQVIGSQTASAIVVSFHTSQTDADANTNVLNAGSHTNTTAYQETIYVRVSNTSDTSCYDTTTFDVLVFDSPVLEDVSDWQICDDNNDGLYNFDFSVKDAEILGALNATDYTISYHENQTDANTDVNEILGTYQNTTNPQTIYFRLENSSNAACYDTGSFTIQVFNQPTASQASDIIICDTDETGRYRFDLSEKDIEVLNGQDTGFYEVSYHPTELDARNNSNPLSNTYYGNTQMSEVIYARVQHKQLMDCYATSQFSLFVNPLPDPDLEEVYVICPDSPDLEIDGGAFESWEWRTNEGNVIGNQQTQNIIGLGNYSLTVTQATNGIFCEKTVAFQVVSSGAPDSFTVDTSGLSDSVIVLVDAIGIGDFEYSIDGENYQTDNQFEVFPGSYTLYVRDPFECRTLTQDIVAMGYEKFFTPNGDGVHENWNVIGTELFPDARLYIYDRYGKLLGQISPQGPGWDGNYLGRPLPSSDYWFKFEYGEGEVFSGHFALKR